MFGQNKIICVAGKNQCSIDFLRFISSIIIKKNILVLPSKSDKGADTWQPSLKKYANKGNNQFFTIKNNPNSISSSLLNRLFRPSAISVKKTQPHIHSDNRFQTSQHLRLRSDQEHQSSTVFRSRRTNKKNENDDAMKIIDSIVSRVSNDEKIEKRLSFKNMRKTTNSSENNILPGIRKLG